MSKPGISVDTRPAVSVVVRKVAELKTAADLAHQVPAAEYVALLAIAATTLAEACMGVVESVGLDMKDVARLNNLDPQVYQRDVVALIREK